MADKRPGQAVEESLLARIQELRLALDGANVAGMALVKRLDRVERALLLLATHVGGIGWNQPLESLLQDIERTFGSDKEC